MARLAGVALLLILVGCRAAAGAPRPTPSEASMTFQLTSSAFEPSAAIPRQYTCDGADQSPPLAWTTPPEPTRSLALIVEDPDAPGSTFVHWVIFNLPPGVSAFAAGVVKQTVLPDGTRQGRNDFRRVGYGGPCPPRGEEHRYFFRLYALDTLLDVTPGASASELRSAMKGHVVSQSELMGTYGR